MNSFTFIIEDEWQKAFSLATRSYSDKVNKELDTKAIHVKIGVLNVIYKR